MGSKQRRGQVLAVGRDIERFPNPEHEAPAFWRDELLQRRAIRSMSGLPHLQRLAVKWHLGFDCDARPFREIAEQLGVSVGTAHNLYSRALEAMYRDLTSDAAGPLEADELRDVA